MIELTVLRLSRNGDNNTVVTMCGAGWVLDMSRGTLCEVHDRWTTTL